jgi:hypothetical protein
VFDVISRMVVADELDRIGDGGNKIFFFNRGGHM